MIFKILGIRNQNSHDRQKSGGQNWKHFREDTHQNPPRGRTLGQESYSCNRKARQTSDCRQPAPPFSPPTPQENQGHSPTRNKSAVSAVPRPKGAAPSLVSSLPLHPEPEARPATMPWTEPGWEWVRQTRALPMHPGHRRAEPDTGRFSELNGGPLFLAARSILGITGERRQLRGCRVGWGTARGRKREDRAGRGCVKAPPPTGPDWGGGVCAEARRLRGHICPYSCFLLGTANPAGGHWAP